MHNWCVQMHHTDSLLDSRCDCAVCFFEDLIGSICSANDLINCRLKTTIYYFRAELLHQTATMLIRSESKRTNEKCNATKKSALKIIWPEPRRAQPECVWVQLPTTDCRLINAMKLFRHETFEVGTDDDGRIGEISTLPQSTCINYKILLLISVLHLSLAASALDCLRRIRFSLGIHSFFFPSSVVRRHGFTFNSISTLDSRLHFDLVYLVS